MVIMTKCEYFFGENIDVRRFLRLPRPFAKEMRESGVYFFNAGHTFEHEIFLTHFYHETFLTKKSNFQNFVLKNPKMFC